MGTEHAIGQVVQMLVVWGPIAVLFTAVVRLLWRAGDRHLGVDLQQLQGQIDALTREIRDLRQQFGRTEPAG